MRAIDDRLFRGPPVNRHNYFPLKTNTLDDVNKYRLPYHLQMLVKIFTK